MMKVLGANIIVTGGCGFIGGHLVEKLLLLGAKITVLDIKLHPKSLFAKNNLKNKVNLKLLDVRERKKIFNIFKKLQPSFVFHLAAEAIVEGAYQNPFNAIETNVIGTVNILDASREITNIKGIIVASSDKAYGKSNIAYKEDMPLKGDHPYDASKSCEDLIANAYFKTYNLPIAVTRFGNVYGEGDLNFGRIIPDICLSVIKKKPLLLRSNGKHVRDYVYVGDVVNGYIFLMEHFKKTLGQAYNFSSHDNLSVLDLVKLAQKELKVKIPIKILNTAKNEIPYQHLNDSKIRKLGWQTNYTVKQTFPQILNWYQKTI